MTPVSATVDGVEVQSNSGTAEDLTASLQPETPPSAPTTEGTPATGTDAVASPKAAPVSTPDDDAEADADPASEAGKALARRKGSLHERLERLTWEKHEERRKAERLEAELAALKQPKPQTPPDTGRPKLKDFVARIGTEFDDYESAVEAHVDALSDFKLAEREKASLAASATHARQTALHTVQSRGLEAHADFDAVLGQFVQQGGRFAPATPDEANGPLGDLEQVILTHPKGHTIGYELAKDPALYQRLLSAQSRVMFMDEMGKLIARLEGAPTGSPSTPAPVSKAKPPVQPAKGQPIATDGPPGDDADDEAHLRYYNQQEAARRRRA